MKTLLAVDPGNVTGWVKAKIISEPDDEFPNGLMQIVDHGTWSGIPLLWARRHNYFEGVDIVVVEDYRVYPHKAQAHVGSRVTAARELGRVELLAWAICKCKPKYQMASQAKQQWPTKRFKRHFPKLYKELGTVHAQDACRHLFTYIENEGLHIFFRREDAI